MFPLLVFSNIRSSITVSFCSLTIWSSIFNTTNIFYISIITIFIVNQFTVFVTTEQHPPTSNPLTIHKLPYKCSILFSMFCVRLFSILPFSNHNLFTIWISQNTKSIRFPFCDSSFILWLNFSITKTLQYKTRRTFIQIKNTRFLYTSFLYN